MEIKLLREHIMLWDRTLSSNNGYKLRAHVDLSFEKPKWRGPFFHNCSLHLYGSWIIGSLTLQMAAIYVMNQALLGCEVAADLDNADSVYGIVTTSKSGYF